MNHRIVLLPAILSLALTGASVPGLADTLPRTTAGVAHTSGFVPMHAAPNVITTSSFPLPASGWAQPETTPSVVGAYIAAVLAISGVPCFDCVNGKTKGTFGSGYPLAYVNTNVLNMGILLEWFNVSDSSPCTVYVSLTLGGKVLKSASGSFTPVKGSVENSQMAVTRSSTWHGLASTSGKVVCGATSFTEKGQFYFQ